MLPAAAAPANVGQRVLWGGARMLVWFGLFILFQAAGALLYNALGLPSAGLFGLLGTAVTLAAAVGAGIAALRWLDGRPASDLGFALRARSLREFGFGFLLGSVALLAASALTALAGWLAFHAQGGTPIRWVVTLLRDLGLLGLAAAAEEAIFRGYPFQVLVRATGAPAAVLLSSAVFAWAHIENPGAATFALVNIFLAGVMLAVAFLVTNSLWFATAVHLGWNWSMASLLDLPVSGLELFDTPLYEPALSGPVWFTGGSFGPEGGLAGTLALGALLVILARYARKRTNVGTE